MLPMTIVIFRIIQILMNVVHHEEANKKKLSIYMYSVYAHKKILISFMYIILTQSEIKSSLLASIIP